jgi:U32 family peptidase
VVQCYREAVDAYFDDAFDDAKVEVWDKRLATVFNRGFWDGYYLGQRLGEWSANYGSQASKRKIYVAKAQNYFSNSKVAEFKVETTQLSVGDEIIISGPTTGVIETTIKEIRVDLQPVQTAFKGQICSIPIEEKVRRADKLYRMADATELKK